MKWRSTARASRGAPTPLLGGKVRNHATSAPRPGPEDAEDRDGATAESAFLVAPEMVAAVVSILVGAKPLTAVLQPPCHPGCVTS